MEAGREEFCELLFIKREILTIFGHLKSNGDFADILMHLQIFFG